MNLFPEIEYKPISEVPEGVLRAAFLGGIGEVYRMLQILGCDPRKAIPLYLKKHSRLFDSDASKVWRDYLMDQFEVNGYWDYLTALVGRKSVRYYHDDSGFDFVEMEGVETDDMVREWTEEYYFDEASLIKTRNAICKHLTELCMKTYPPL